LCRSFRGFSDAILRLLWADPKRIRPPFAEGFIADRLEARDCKSGTVWKIDDVDVIARTKM